MPADWLGLCFPESAHLKVINALLIPTFIDFVSILRLFDYYVVFDIVDPSSFSFSFAFMSVFQSYLSDIYIFIASSNPHPLNTGVL